MKISIIYTVLRLLCISAIMFNCQGEDLCIECNLRAPSETKTIAFFDEPVRFNSYIEDNGTFNISTDNEVNLIDVINNITIESGNFDITPNNLAAIVAFSGMQLSSFNTEEVSHLILYLRESDGFRVLLFKKNDKRFNIVPSYTFQSNYLASNDIYDLRNILYPTQKINNYVLINKNLIKPFNTNKNSFQLFLNQKKNIILSNCQPPCSPEIGSCIVVGGGIDWSGEWVCSEIADEIEDRECAEQKILSAIDDPIKYSPSEILIDSYNFKYNFLERRKKGKEYITLYYEFSKQLNSDIDKDLAIYIYNSIRNDILPICLELVNNTENSNKILITHERYNLLKTRIDYIDKKLENPKISDILNTVRHDLNFYYNKPISYIYKSFE